MTIPKMIVDNITADEWPAVRDAIDVLGLSAPPIAPDSMRPEISVDIPGKLFNSSGIGWWDTCFEDTDNGHEWMDDGYVVLSVEEFLAVVGE